MFQTVKNENIKHLSTDLFLNAEERAPQKSPRSLAARVKLRLRSLSCSPISHETRQRQLNTRSKMICHPPLLFSSRNLKELSLVNLNTQRSAFSVCTIFWYSRPSTIFLCKMGSFPDVFSIQMRPHLTWTVSHSVTWRVWHLLPMMLSIKQDLRSVCLSPIRSPHAACLEGAHLQHCLITRALFMAVVFSFLRMESKEHGLGLLCHLESGPVVCNLENAVADTLRTFHFPFNNGHKLCPIYSKMAYVREASIWEFKQLTFAHCFA